MQKRILILTWFIIIVAVITVGGVFAYQYFATKNNLKKQTLNIETSDWKTYKNNEYGFEFKYPNEWKTPTTYNHIPNASFWIYLGCPEIKMGGAGGCPLQVILTSASSPEKFLSQEFSPDIDLNGKRSDISYQQINNIKTVSFTNFSDYPGNSKYLTFLGNKYYITFSDYLLSYQQNGIYNQILSTFKFTK